MKASEARSKAEDVLRSKHLLETSEVISQINKAVEKGEFKAHVYKILPPSVIDHLKTEGYKVNTSFDRNEEFTTISW